MNDEVIRFDACFVPEETSSSEYGDDGVEQDVLNASEGGAVDDAAMAIEAMVVPPQARLAQRVLSKKKREARPSELISRADFEMPDVYERLKMYMKMLFDFIRTHPRIKGKDNERNFAFVLRRAINVLNDVVRTVAPTPNRVQLEEQAGEKYSKLWKRLVTIVSYLYDYDEAFEVLAKTYAAYNARPVRHNSGSYSLRSLTSIFFRPTQSTPAAGSASVAPAASATGTGTAVEETFTPKLSRIEFDGINKKLVALHEFLVGASADARAHVDMTRFNESAENDPWYYPKKHAF